MNEKTMHEALGRIVEAGRKELNRLGLDIQATAHRAQEEVRKADEEMKALVTFAEAVPTAIFDRFSSVWVGMLEVCDNYSHECDGRFELHGPSSRPADVRKVYGKGFEKGKYRVIVTLEKTE